MSPRDINIMIAACVGYHSFEVGYDRDTEVLYGLPVGRELQPGESRIHKEVIPDYSTDLNAIEGVIKTLSADEFEEYWETLFELVDEENKSESGRFRLAYNALALLRCKSFLILKGLWKD